MPCHVGSDKINHGMLPDTIANIFLPFSPQ
jgi:hypothetical protein